MPESKPPAQKKAPRQAHVKKPAPTTLVLQIRRRPQATLRHEWRILLDVSGNKTVLEHGTAWGLLRAAAKARRRGAFLLESLRTPWSQINPKR